MKDPRLKKDLEDMQQSTQVEQWARASPKERSQLSSRKPTSCLHSLPLLLTELFQLQVGKADVGWPAGAVLGGDCSLLSSTSKLLNGDVMAGITLDSQQTA